MPKTFNFYGGTPNNEGVARAFETSVQAQQGASAMKAQAYSQASQAFQSGIARGMEMAQQRGEAEKGRAFQERMFNRQQEAETGRQGTYMAFQSKEAENARASRFDEMEAEQAFRSTEAEKGRRFEAIQTGAEFSNRRQLQEMQLRYQQEQARQEAAAKQAKQEAIDAATFEATSFALTPQGAKQVYIPVKMSYLDALVDSTMPREVVERAVIEAFPTVKPVKVSGMDGAADKEDRSALDAKIKELSQEAEFEVPNMIAMQRGMRHLTATYGAEGAKAAISELESRAGVKPARGIKEARGVVKDLLLKRLADIKNAGRGAQIQGGTDVLGMLQGAEQASDAVAAPQQFQLSEEMLKRAGVAMDQISRELQQVVGLGPYAPTVNVDGSGRLVLQPSSDETGQAIPVPPGAQEALDALMQNETIRNRILGVSGTPEQERTPSEVKDMGTMRQMAGSVPPQISNVGILPMDAMRAAPQSAEQAFTPGIESLNAYRDRIRRERQAAGGKKK